ncbi:hypothetical protein ABPG74_018699 [Tetrahymena malaccensis]
MILSQNQQFNYRNPNERAIYQRRVQEEKLDKLKTKLNQEFYEKEFACWENRGKAVNESNYIKQRLAELRVRSQRALNERRQKLANLLGREHEQYKQEIHDLQETPEDIRQKMIQRVNHLKEEKEKERLRVVEEKREQQFVRNADELRKVDADFHELKTYHEQNIQIMEKQKILQEKYEEEMIYAELYKYDIKKKEKEELVKEYERKKKIDERNKVLHTQLSMNQTRRNQEKDLDSLEKMMLKEEWKKEEERHKKQQQELFQFNKDLNNEIKESNEELQRRKAYEKDIEKQQDKEMISRIITKEQMLDRLEAEQKRKFQEETKAFLLNFKNRSNETHQYEAELERLINEEAEKQWQRQNAIWQKEREAKIKLMHEVYDSRKTDIEVKQTLVQVEKEQKELEKDILTKAVAAYEQEVERKKKELYLTNKQHQSSLIGQMHDKDRKRQEELEKIRQEEEQERLRNIAYEQRLQEKKQQGKQLLDELRKKRPF